MTARKLTVGERLNMMAKALEFSALTADRMANDAIDAVTRRNAENVGIILRHLATAIDAAGLGHFGALEALAQDATATMCAPRFVAEMEARIEEAKEAADVWRVAISDEREAR